MLNLYIFLIVSGKWGWENDNTAYRRTTFNLFLYFVSHLSNSTTKV